MYFDQPRVQAGDVDGDGRADLVATSRHELRIFRQRENGRFPHEPDQSLPLGRISAADHVNNQGSVRVELGHFDDDGRVDMLVTSSSGSFFDSNTELAVHLNRAGSFDLRNPDQVIPTAGLATTQVTDLDGDGRMELVSVRLASGILEIVEVLLTEAIDAEVEIRRRDGALPFEEEPWQTRTLDVGMNFETFRSRGFVPTLQIDLNGDGFIDFLSSGAGEEIEIYLGNAKDGFKDLHASQDLDTGGRIRFGALDQDGLTDFILYGPAPPGACRSASVPIAARCPAPRRSRPASRRVPRAPHQRPRNRRPMPWKLTPRAGSRPSASSAGLSQPAVTQ